MALSPLVSTVSAAGDLLLPRLTLPLLAPKPPSPPSPVLSPKDMLVLELLVPTVLLLTTEPPVPPPPPIDCSRMPWEPWPVPKALSPVATLRPLGTSRLMLPPRPPLPPSPPMANDAEAERLPLPLEAPLVTAPPAPPPPPTD